MTGALQRLRLVWVLLASLLCLTTGTFASIRGYDAGGDRFIAANSAEIIAPSVDDIVRANQGFASGRTLTGEVDTVLANMAYREGLYDKTATAIRDIAGRHLFQDGNKRTAQAIAEQMMKANGGAATPAQIRSVIDQVGQGGLRSVEEISAALRGAK
jgi:prophage maintenance system killer protein